MTEYLVTITFPEESKTYQGYTDVVNGAGPYGVRGIAILERSEAGVLSVPQASDPSIGSGTAGGTLIGMLVGVLGGPLGMLLGAGVGAMSGALVDAGDADDNQLALGLVAEKLAPGQNVLVVDAEEGDPDALDRVVADLGGVVTRTPVADVEAELKARDEAAKEAAKAAKKALREQKHAEREARKAEREG